MLFETYLKHISSISGLLDRLSFAHVVIVLIQAFSALRVHSSYSSSACEEHTHAGRGR